MQPSGKLCTVLTVCKDCHIERTGEALSLDHRDPCKLSCFHVAWAFSLSELYLVVRLLIHV